MRDAIRKPKPPLLVYRSEQFRTPMSVEQAMGLWVDRIGASVGTERR